MTEDEEKEYIEESFRKADRDEKRFAPICASELKRDWNGWTEEDQIDYCGWLRLNYSDFPEIVRYIIHNATGVCLGRQCS